MLPLGTPGTMHSEIVTHPPTAEDDMCVNGLVASLRVFLCILRHADDMRDGVGVETSESLCRQHGKPMVKCGRITWDEHERSNLLTFQTDVSQVQLHIHHAQPSAYLIHQKGFAYCNTELTLAMPLSGNLPDHLSYAKVSTTVWDRIHRQDSHLDF